MQQMTFGKARSKLKRYYRVHELVESYMPGSNDIIIMTGIKQQSTGSLAEATTIRNVDLLASIQDTEIALKKLPQNHRQYIELRFQREMSVRAAGREMFMAKTTAERFEDTVLTSYIEALGYEVKEAVK